MSSRGAALLLVAALLLAGCASAPAIVSWSAGAGVQDFQKRGPSQVRDEVLSESIKIGDDDCRGVVERYQPAFAGLPPTIPFIFAHGLLRDVRNHRDFARHLASWGASVYLVGHCSGGWSKSRIDTAGGGAGLLAGMMRQVADASGAQKIVYGGFSAGGRASRLAAFADARTVGWLGLDPVDRIATGGQTVSFPMYALFAPAQGCNAQQMGRMLTKPSVAGKALEVSGTTHCHFEAPTDFLCQVACGEPGDVTQNHVLRQRIWALATGFVRWRAGLDGDQAPLAWQAVDGVFKELILNP